MLLTTDAVVRAIAEIITGILVVLFEIIVFTTYASVTSTPRFYAHSFIRYTVHSFAQDKRIRSSWVPGTARSLCEIKDDGFKSNRFSPFRRFSIATKVRGGGSISTGR
ncbi:hypothetical protein BTA51_11180 [Hahella sp. CCB-MM4]|nr:hypothetical protein BTA51_11180 [Hahella sp. CCB-MM4]